MVDHLMVSDVGAGGEGWPGGERLAETGAARALWAARHGAAPPVASRTASASSRRSSSV